MQRLLSFAAVLYPHAFIPDAITRATAPSDDPAAGLNGIADIGGVLHRNGT